MARTVEVTLELDSQGVVQKVNAAGESFEKLAEAEKDAEQASEQVSDSQRDAAQAAEASAEAQRDAAQAAEQYATQSDRVAGAGSNASQVIFSLGDAAQDAQFGLRGVANNIAFTAESFAELQRQSSSTTGAFQSLGSALTGPAGVILGLQAVLALGPQLASFFSSREQEAEALGEAYSSAAENLLSFQSDLSGFEVEGLEQAKEARDTLQDRVDLQEEQVSNLQTLLKVRTATGAEQAQLTRQERQTARETEERLGLENASAEAIRQSISEKQKEVQASKSAVKQAKALVKNRKAALQVTEALGETSANREGTTQYRKEIQKTVGALQELNRVAGAGRANFSGINEFLSSHKQEQARQMRHELRNMGVVMEDLQKKGLKLGDVLSGGLSNAIAQAATAIGQGESVLAAVGQTLGSLLQRIGKAAIAYGISLSAIKSLNPVAAIAGGTALVAAGAALSSALSDTQSAIGAGSAGRTAPRERNNIEDGGELGANVDVPGRREGGPVEGGQLYETHGLGSREFFLPSGDGRIMTESAMRSQRRGSGRMSVDVSASGSITAEDFDIASLRAELNELSADVSDLT